MTQTTTDNGIRVLTPSEGKMLRHGDTFSVKVWLGVNDSPENWAEVDYSEYTAWLSELENADSDGADYADTDYTADPIYATELERVKAEKIGDISRYDKSEAVNIFYINGIPMWLDKTTRVGLAYRLNAESEAGKESTTLWWQTTPITMNIAFARTNLYNLEVYASQCFDVTQSHKAAVEAMKDIESVRAYDYTEGYPTPLSVTTDN